MKRLRLASCLMTLAALVLTTAHGLEPRQNINPALLYWQAFSRFPELSGDEAGLLLGNARGAVSAEERLVAGMFDESFALIQRARLMAEPCDWGSDPADGPHAFVPDLKRIRRAADAVVLRVRVALADGRQSQACDELLGLSVLARNTAQGGSLVTTMVQLAAEVRVLDIVAANFDQLTPQSRARIAKGLNELPARLSVADAMVQEKAGFQGWIIGKLEAQRGKPGDDARVLSTFRTLMGGTFASESDLADRIIEAAGGTSAGVIRYIKDVDPHYRQSMVIARASASEVKRRTGEFEADINSTTNLLARVVLPNVTKARLTELKFLERLKKLPDQVP